MKIIPQADFFELKKTVIDKDLCSHCNICVETCPIRAIGIGNRKDSYKPFVSSGCISCGDCLTVCPGKEFDFSGIAGTVFGRVNSNRYIGSYRSIYIGHAKDEKVRNAGASGGVITAVLLSMIRSGLINGASVITSRDDKPWLVTRKIVETEDAIMRAAQSKYTISQVVDEKDSLCSYKGKVAFVGLPCQIQALRKYEFARGAALGNIKFYIGLYCGNQLYFDATESLLRRFGIKNYNDIKSLEYRHGPWPGEFRVVIHGGKEFSVNRITFNYLNLFYKVRRCLTCIDLTSEYADISVGDGWIREKDSLGRGYSVVIARSERGESLIEAAKQHAFLKMETISEKDTICMHSHLLDDKKNGAFIRMAYLKFLGKDIPDYQVSFPLVSLKKRAMGFFIMTAYIIGRLRMSRLAVNLIPLGLMERILDGIRRSWIVSSRKRILKGDPEIK